jgi:hypothetical protein
MAIRKTAPKRASAVKIGVFDRRQNTQANLIVLTGHAPHKETVLVFRIDDPKFLDCYFQR